MAGIPPLESITSTSHIQPSYQKTLADTTPKTGAVQKEEETSKSSSAEKSSKQETENVIATSVDGDTVQASPDALDRLKKEDELGGRLIAKNHALSPRPESREKEIVSEQLREDEQAKEKRAELLKKEEERTARLRELLKKQIQKEQDSEQKDKTITGTEKDDRQDPLKKSDKAKDKEAETKITSYDGYSDSQLQQLYQKGRITKQEYDKEVNARKEERGRKEESEKDFAEFNKTGQKMVTDKAKSEMDEEELAGYEASPEANPLDIAQRSELIMQMQELSRDPFRNDNI